MEISYSMSIGGTEPTKSKEPELWAFCGIDIIPAPDENVLLRRQDDDRRQFVRRDVAAVLDACKTFQTLETHALAAGDIIPELKGHPEHALPVLKQMAELGFLRPASELIERWTSGPAPAPSPDELPKVFIITCDRPAAVDRLLGSLADNPQNNGFEITLIDDSRDEGNLQENEALITTWGDKSSLQLKYFGAAARAQLIAELIGELPEHEGSIRFLIDRAYWPGFATYGVSRNLALLLSVGRRLIVLDDDVIAAAYGLSDKTTHFRFGNTSDRRMAFYSDQPAMLAAQTTLTESPLVLTSEMLGLSLHHSGRRFDFGPEKLRGENSADWWHLKAESKVIMTQCGTLGDPGTGDRANWVINLSQEDLKRLHQAGNSISETLDKRACWMGYQANTLMRFGAMSGVTGLDHSELLPPYTPVLRGEDFLFGVMLEHCIGDGLVLGQNWNVPHIPVESRNRPSLTIPTTATIGLGIAGEWLNENVAQSGYTRKESLEQMASAIDNLAHQDRERIASLTKNRLAKKNVAILDKVRRHMRSELGNTEWSAFLSRANEELMQSLTSSSDALNLSESNEEQTLKNIKQFATALRIWPTLRELV